MIKRLLVAACLFLSFVSFAQEGTASPYSFYGLGDMRFKGTADTRAMGGLSVIPDSIHMNLQNPAFYSHLKLTTLSLGASYATTKLKTNSSEEKSRRTTLDYLAVGIPMGKFGAGFGLMPYTSVGYKLESPVTEDQLQHRRYTGNGGLNKAFVGASYNFTKNFSVGAELGYYFGDIETSAIFSITDVQYGTRELNSSAANGTGFTAGASYMAKVGKKLQFSAAATYSPESTIRFSNERNIATIQFLTSNAIRVIDEIDVPVTDTEIKLPTKFSFGSALGEARKWMAGAEVTFQQHNSLTNRFADIDNVSFENSVKYTVGGYFIPNYAAFSNYAKKITYRGGLRYENTGLVINDKSITDAAFTLGLGLPLGSGSFSNINIGFEYGKRGTRDAGLVEENYMNFSVGLSFNDRWFVKRKYD